MAHDPGVTLSKTASDSLTCRQIVADFLQSIAKQRMPFQSYQLVSSSVVI